MRSTIETAKAIFTAYVDKDRDKAMSLLADDFQFTSPLDNALDRRQYIEICWPNSSHIVDFAFQYIVADGDRVFVTYEATAKGGKRFRNTEIITVRAEKISAVEVYFGWNVPHELPAGRHRDPA